MPNTKKHTRYDEDRAIAAVRKAFWHKLGYLWLCFGPIYVGLSIVRHYYDDLTRLYSIFWNWYSHRAGLLTDVSAFFVAMLFGYGLFSWRRYGSRSYGVTEIAVGAFSSMIGMHDLATNATNAMLKVAGGIYIVVRGLDNYLKGVEACQKRRESSGEVVTEAS